MKEKKPFLYYFSMILLLLVLCASAGLFYLFDHNLQQKENELSHLQQQLSLIEKDNELLQQQIDQITEYLESYQQDERYEELELWKKLREQLKERSSS